MNRQLIATILLFLLFSCNSQEKKETIENFFIAECSGFYLIDSVELKVGSTKLDIMQYFEFKSDSFVKVSKRLNNRFTKFYSVNNTDTLGLEDLLNKTLLNKFYKSEYSAIEPEIYDGFHYILYYKTSRNREFIISYIPHHLDDSLKRLH
ncbi:MAG TPA: hypothetical protein DCQ31_13580 [Bacteroidales bacterium]|nr:hypothetical protein [Bacteroidales bacterium]